MMVILRQLYGYSRLLGLISLIALSSCIHTSLEFPIPPVIAGQRFSLSADAINLDTLPSQYLSSTHRLTVYNPSDRELTGLRIQLESKGIQGFQINVDGTSGIDFSALKIAPRDSMLILVRAYLPESANDHPERVTDNLRIQTGDSPAYLLPLRAVRQNMIDIDNLSISSDQTISSVRPLFIRGKLIVDEGVTLQLLPPTRLYFGPNASLEVRGRLVAVGQVDKPISFEGIRRDLLLPYIPYSRVPGQWKGIVFGSTSRDNELRYIRINSATIGLSFGEQERNDTPLATISHSQITNCSEEGVVASTGTLILSDSEVSNAGATCLSLRNGRYNIQRSSIINNYEWGETSIPWALAYTQDGSSDLGSLLQINYSVVDGKRGVSNSNTMGESGGCLYLQTTETNPNISIQNSYLRSIDYSSKISGIIWKLNQRPRATDNLISSYRRLGRDKTDRIDYAYDFRPLPSAPFVRLGRTNESLPLDLSGRERNPSSFSCGAYELE